MRRLLALAFMAVSMIGAQQTQAQSNMVVVELYTSQGCSSCPPADALLDKITERDDVIPLALHVDYWDYIGWKDNFGSPQYSARQKSYARYNGHRTVYTPQMIINGTDQLIGHKPMELVDLINQKSSKATPVSLNLTRNGDHVTILAEASKAPKKPMLVQLVRYKPSETVDITRGENAGRSLHYSNIVTDWQVVEKWDGRSPLKVRVKAVGAEPVVVIIQAVGPGQIYAAARLR